LFPVKSGFRFLRRGVLVQWQRMRRRTERRSLTTMYIRNRAKDIQESEAVMLVGLRHQFDETPRNGRPFGNAVSAKARPLRGAGIAVEWTAERRRTILTRYQGTHRSGWQHCHGQYFWHGKARWVSPRSAIVLRGIAPMFR